MARARIGKHPAIGFVADHNGIHGVWLRHDLEGAEKLLDFIDALGRETHPGLKNAAKLRQDDFADHQLML